jgi:hypothetical protein
MKRTHSFFIAILFIALIVTASEAQKVGTSSLQFLKVMPVARATAMGDAFVTLASGADALYWNPSGIVSSQSLEVTGTMTLWLFDCRQSAIGVALPLGDWGTIGAQFQYVDFGEIQETRIDHLSVIETSTGSYYNPGLTGRTFSPSSILIGISYAKQLTDKFSTGGSIKFASESLWDEPTVTVEGANGVIEEVGTRANVLLFDFGMHYNTGYRSIQLGIAVQNFGSQVKFAKEAYPAPLSFRLGAAANIIGNSALIFTDESNRLTFAYDLFQPNDYAQQMHFGVEYSLSEMIFLRGGYKENYDTDGLTFGVGVATDLSGFPMTFDYSYGAMGEYLPSVHRISLGVQFK